MANPPLASMRDNLANQKVMNPSIVQPPIQANNFEVKATLLQLVQGNQFGGNPTENPNEHLNDFVANCGMYKTNGVTNEAVRLMLFPHSLRGKAKEWLKSCAPESLSTWDEVSKAFLKKFFPPQRTARIKSELQSFQQGDDETLYEAWERYKSLQRLCPHHGIGDDDLINNFYEGLDYDLKMNLDSGSGLGAFDRIDHVKGRELIEEMANRTSHWSNDRSRRKGKASVESANNLELMEMMSELKQQVALIRSSSPKARETTTHQVFYCEFCGEQGHVPSGCPLMGGDGNCMEQVNGLWESIPAQNVFNNNTYHPGMRNHQNVQNPTFQQRPQINQQPFQAQQPFQQVQQPFQQPPPPKSNMELMMEQMMAHQSTFINQATQKQVETTSSINQLRSQVQASKKMTDTQIAQLTSQIHQMQGQSGKFPGTTETNPKTVNSIFLRSGKEVEHRAPMKRRKRIIPKIVVEKPKEVESPKVLEEEPIEIVIETPKIVENPKVVEEEPIEIIVENPKLVETPKVVEPSEYTPKIIFEGLKKGMKPYVPPVPFPQRLARAKLEAKYGKFVEMMKGINVSLPLIDVIKEIPTYARFLKELISNKREGASTSSLVAMNHECSAALVEELPPKLDDPGSFSIPCNVGGVYIKRALCDSGASVSVMPFSIFEKLDGYTLLPTSVSLQLADRSVQYPRGMVEDVPIKIGDIVIPCDFYVMDIPEDAKTQVILGRPCLATGGAIIDIGKGILTLNVNNENIEFSLDKVMKEPSEGKACYMVEIIEECVDSRPMGASDPIHGYISGKGVKTWDMELDELELAIYGELRSRDEDYNVCSLDMSFEELEALVLGDSSIRLESQEEMDRNDEMMNLNDEKLTFPFLFPHPTTHLVVHGEIFLFYEIPPPLPSSHYPKKKGKSAKKRRKKVDKKLWRGFWSGSMIIFGYLCDFEDFARSFDRLLRSLGDLDRILETRRPKILMKRFGGVT